MDIMLGEVKREEGAEEAMGAQTGEKVTVNRGYNCDITSFLKYNYSIIIFDVEAQAITTYSDSVFFIECCKSGPPPIRGRHFFSLKYRLWGIKLIALMQLSNM